MQSCCSSGVPRSSARTGAAVGDAARINATAAILAFMWVSPIRCSDRQHRAASRQCRCSYGDASMPAGVLTAPVASGNRTADRAGPPHYPARRRSVTKPSGGKPSGGKPVGRRRRSGVTAQSVPMDRRKLTGKADRLRWHGVELAGRTRVRGVRVWLLFPATRRLTFSTDLQVEHP